MWDTTSIFNSIAAGKSSLSIAARMHPGVINFVAAFCAESSNISELRYWICVCVCVCVCVFVVCVCVCVRA